MCPTISEGSFHMSNQMWKSKESVGQQMREFPKGKDDILDAVQYCMQMARRCHSGQPVIPYIAIDPAYSDDNDYSALACGCWYNDQFWLLDIKTIRTSRPEHVVRLLFRMWDKFSTNNRSNGGKPLSFDLPVSPLGYRGQRKSAEAANSFTIDLNAYRLNKRGSS
jgi:hypothetical protein